MSVSGSNDEKKHYEEIIRLLEEKTQADTDIIWRLIEKNGEVQAINVLCEGNKEKEKAAQEYALRLLEKVGFNDAPLSDSEYSQIKEAIGVAEPFEFSPSTYEEDEIIVVEEEKGREEEQYEESETEEETEEQTEEQIEEQIEEQEQEETTYLEEAAYLEKKAEELKAENAASPGKHATGEKVAALLNVAKDFVSRVHFQPGMYFQPLEKILTETKEKLVDGLKFEADSKEEKKLDGWIDLANKADDARIKAEEASPYEKKAADKDYEEAKATFDKAIREGVKDKDPKLAYAARTIKNRVENHNGRKRAIEGLSALRFPEDKSFAQMSEGELLAEIIFRLLALLLACTKLLAFSVEKDKKIGDQLKQMIQGNLQDNPQNNPQSDITDDEEKISQLESDVSEAEEDVVQTLSWTETDEKFEDTSESEDVPEEDKVFDESDPLVSAAPRPTPHPFPVTPPLTPVTSSFTSVTPPLSPMNPHSVLDGKDWDSMSVSEQTDELFSSLDSVLASWSKMMPAVVDAGLTRSDSFTASFDSRARGAPSLRALASQSSGFPNESSLNVHLDTDSGVSPHSRSGSHGPGGRRGSHG